MNNNILFFIQVTTCVLLYHYVCVDVIAQTKRAVVIGLGSQLDSSWGKINGDKDISYVYEMLRRAHFSDITTLKNEQATKKKIKNALISLCEKSQKGDVVYIHFSGHGQQMVDINGDENDGKDESWIPYDAYKKPCKKDMGEKHLSDDEIAVLLNNIRKQIGDRGKILVVVDACHSGTATWCYNCEEEIIRGSSEVFCMAKPVGVSYNFKSSPKPWITISACKDNQGNYELKGKKVGKLSYALFRITSSNKRFTNNEFEKMLHSFFLENSRSHHQTPVVTGLTSNVAIQKILK